MAKDMNIGDKVTVRPQGFEGWVIGFTEGGRVNVRLRVPASLHRHDRGGRGQKKRISVLAKDVFLSTGSK